ncbi:hypothetical protein COJ27_26015 [Bacillus cereus]|nr:hypothetical protein [Bacillus cereus]PFL58906.1 hypothetical protein COJ27_26015 [Bacillus cereus]
MDGLRKNKERKIRKYNSKGLLAFLHMSDQIKNSYLALRVLGTVLIGAVLLEKHLLKNDYALATKFVSERIYHGMQIGGVSAEW